MYLLQEPSVRPVGLVYFMNTRLRSVRVYERSPGHFQRKFYWGGAKFRKSNLYLPRRNPVAIYMWDNILYSRQVYSHAKMVKSIWLSNDELVTDTFFSALVLFIITTVY